MKDSTTATQIKLFGKKTPDEIMKLAEQIYPVQSPTEFKKEAVFSVSSSRANAVSFENTTPLNEATFLTR